MEPDFLKHGRFADAYFVDEMFGLLFHVGERGCVYFYEHPRSFVDKNFTVHAVGFLRFKFERHLDNGCQFL